LRSRGSDRSCSAVWSRCSGSIDGTQPARRP
jgi:hypothetical protein